VNDTTAKPPVRKLTPEQLLSLFERGYSLTSIADKVGQSATEVQLALIASFGEKRLTAAITANAEAAMDRAVAELDDCVDKDQNVQLAAIKAKLEYHKWRAATLSPKYKPTPDKTALGGGLTINIVGMSGAVLRQPTIIDQ
jgi:hypothetical protein